MSGHRTDPRQVAGQRMHFMELKKLEMLRVASSKWLRTLWIDFNYFDWKRLLFWIGPGHPYLVFLVIT